MKTNNSVKQVSCDVMDDVLALDLLADRTQLSRQKIKDAMSKGACRLRSQGKGQRGRHSAIDSRQRGHARRLRRAKTQLRAGDIVEFFYNPKILSEEPLQPSLVADNKSYSVWLKPPGLLTQGTDWGDHCSLLRQVELHFSNQRQVYLIHRLDQWAAGLVVIAHQKQTAAGLSKTFQQRDCTKRYIAELHGHLIRGESNDAEQNGTDGWQRLEAPLNGKAACTEFRILPVEANAATTLVDISLITGRKHQIRQHFALLGHPLWGERLYGGHETDTSAYHASPEAVGKSIHLFAYALGFQCPVAKAYHHFTAPPALWPAWSEAGFNLLQDWGIGP